MLVELHLLQNFGPSCLNRDDTNTPKECEFGGHRRARISSQCLKRAIRWHPAFRAALAPALGVRTKRLAEAVAAQVGGPGRDRGLVQEMASALVQEAVGRVGAEDRTRVLVHVGMDEINRLAGVIRDSWEDLAAAPATARQRRLEAAVASFRPGTQAPDIALFGRMIAENANMQVEAACQVAHALSTHRVTTEMDFFTAVDDLKQTRRGSAEMIGTLEFCSACFYRYAVLDQRQLLRNLSGDTDLACRVGLAFVEATIEAVPSGRQTSYAAHSLPSFILVVMRRRGVPWSLVNAFETPVSSPDHDRQGLVGRSIAALDAHWGELVRLYGGEGIAEGATCWLGTPPVVHLQPYRVSGVAALLQRVREQLAAGAVD